MKTIKNVIVLLLTGLSLSHGVAAEFQRNYTERVQYSENHDPSMVWLADGRKVTVSFGEVSWEEMDKWAKGRAMSILYTPENGSWLVDDTTQSKIKILGGLSRYPIDVLLERYLKRYNSTQDMVEGYDAAANLWKMEATRTQKELDGKLSKSGKTTLQKAQQRWSEFCAAETKVIAEMSDRDGTIWRIVAAERFMNLQKQRAQTLMAYLEDADQTTTH